MRWMIRTSAALAMIMSAPELVAILAAESFVPIPPVPTLELVPFPIPIIESSRWSTTLINSASGFLFGSSVYKPSISESRIRRSASISAATIADSVSLSPNSISKVETVSFSLTIGIAPSFKSSENVFLALKRFSGSAIVFFVISTCAATWLYSAKSFW